MLSKRSIVQAFEAVVRILLGFFSADSRLTILAVHLLREVRPVVNFRLLPLHGVVGLLLLRVVVAGVVLAVGVAGVVYT